MLAQQRTGVPPTPDEPEQQRSAGPSQVPSATLPVMAATTAAPVPSHLMQANLHTKLLFLHRAAVSTRLYARWAMPLSFLPGTLLMIAMTIYFNYQMQRYGNTNFDPTTFFYLPFIVFGLLGSLWQTGQAVLLGGKAEYAETLRLLRTSQASLTVADEAWLNKLQDQLPDLALGMSKPRVAINTLTDRLKLIAYFFPQLQHLQAYPEARLRRLWLEQLSCRLSRLFGTPLAPIALALGWLLPVVGMLFFPLVAWPAYVIAPRVMRGEARLQAIIEFLLEEPPAKDEPGHRL